MGIVYKAIDRRLGRTVCLKLLRPDLVVSPAQMQRFRREAKAISSLNHPNICTIHELDELDGLPYFILEWIDGESLRSLLNHELDATTLASIILRTVRALAAAHAKQIVHRDIKPENIVVRNDGLAKLLDFGLARLHCDLSIDSEKTMPGALLGTIPYMSPEQARAEEVASSLVCVSGDAGIGKTTLVEAFLVELLQRHRITVMTGRCSERFAGAEAYLPVFDALRGLLDGHDRDDAIQLLKSHAPSWFSLIASSQTESDVRIQSPSEFTQERLKLEFRAFLTELSRIRPIALLLDDVHWADASTIDLLSFLKEVPSRKSGIDWKCTFNSRLVFPAHLPTATERRKHKWLIERPKRYARN